MCIEFVIQEGEINILGLYLCTAVGIYCLSCLKNIHSTLPQL